jgi:bifunctional pyridoxal-dependent enzyme with beta-cystathionase and maltose regulon repressor activities
VEIHPSARLHGVGDDDMLHAIENSMAVEDLGEDPDRWLVVGPDLAANMLEVIVLVTDEGDELIIHAMPLRPVYRRLLKP